MTRFRSRIKLSRSRRLLKWNRSWNGVCRYGSFILLASAIILAWRRLLQNRDEKRRKLENLRSKKANVLETSGLLSAPMDRSVLADIDDQIESVQANIDYLQDQIAECQKQIMEVEEGAKV